MTPIQIRGKIKHYDPEIVLDFPYPKPYPDNPLNVKAVLLGCDPSNKHSNKMPYVFAIKSGLKIFNRVITGIEEQLAAIGLSLGIVYSQNLCRNYFKYETSKNPIWNDVARLWIPIFIEELKENKIPENVPVLLTSEVLYKVLLNDGVKPKKAKEFYELKDRTVIPIKPEDNKLHRPLLPFYRHHAYKLIQWNKYRITLYQTFHK